MNEARILELARAAGLSPEWTNISNQTMQVSPHSLGLILDALGLPCASDTECDDSMARLAAIRDTTHLLPLITATVGQPIDLPASPALAGKTYRIEFETGGHVEGRLPADLSHGLHLPAVGLHGYHRLLAGDEQTTLAVAPARCFGMQDALHGKNWGQARPWGLGVQLYSLRRMGDGGYGDYTALADLARQAVRHGAAAIAISPVHAMFSADVDRFSPYGPSSRLFYNALHIDPASVLGPDALAGAIDELNASAQADGGHDIRAQLQRLEQCELVDWPAAASLRLRILRVLYRRFAEGMERQDFDAFLAQGGEALQSHARFEALHAIRLARGEDAYWRHWPDALRDPRSAAVDAFAREHSDEVGFHAFLQWQAARALENVQRSAREAGMPIGLVTDLAVGADNGGSQAWSRQKEIITGLSVGAPPDQLSPHGQAWGLGAFSPHAMKAQGFHAYIEMLRAAFATAGGIRIDHVLGLARLWLVPDGASPEDGAYLQYPFADLIRLIALESWRHRAVVIGEDLGTVPAGFDRQLADAGLLGIRVLLFQRDGSRFLQPAEWTPDAIATTTTHDLPTIGGWWLGRDIDWRVKLDLLEKGQSEETARQNRQREKDALWQALQQGGFVGAGESQPQQDVPLDAAIAFMASAPAALAMLPIEDALGLHEQPNLPGTTDAHPNWRRRLPQPVDQVLDAPDTTRRLGILDRTRLKLGDPQ